MEQTHKVFLEAVLCQRTLLKGHSRRGWRPTVAPDVSALNGSSRNKLRPTDAPTALVPYACLFMFALTYVCVIHGFLWFGIDAYMLYVVLSCT